MLLFYNGNSLIVRGFMKKILLIFLLLNSIVFAADYSIYCSNKVPTKTLGGVAASTTGFNTLTRNIIESAASNLIYKETKSKFKIKIDSFYGINLLNGIFKSLSASAKTYQDGDFWAHDVKAETICNYNQISLKNNEIKFAENLVLKYSAKINQDDIDKMVHSGSYKKIIDKMNQDKTISSLVKIKSYDVEIKKDKLLFRYNLMPSSKYGLAFILKPIVFVFSANLEVIDGEIKICNFGLNSESTKNSAFSSIIAKLNPTFYKFKVDEKNKAKIEVTNVKIENNEILFDGFILIKKTK